MIGIESMMEEKENMETPSMLEEIVGSKAKVRTLMFLLQHPIFEYTIQDIVENTGLSRISVAKALETFQKYKIVVKTRRVGRIEFYQIDLSNPLVDGFLDLNKKFAEYLVTHSPH